MTDFSGNKIKPLRGGAVLAALAGVILLWLPVLLLHLTAVLFAALTVYGFSRALEGRLKKQWPHMKHPALCAVLLLLAGLVLLLGSGIDWLGDRIGPHPFAALMMQAAQILDQLHAVLPPEWAARLPHSADSLNAAVSGFLKTHSAQIQTTGVNTLRTGGHLLAGVVIGALAAVQLKPPAGNKPLPQKIYAEFEGLLHSFTQVFFAQIRISAVNTLLTAVYLLGILPLMGKPLPLAGTLVLFTFIAGLLPVVGNLVSNSFIVIMSLNHGITVSAFSLAWLVGIHKLEYFLNAHFIGHKIKAAVWEILVAMLVLEAAFGLAGLIAAPVIYAQIKHSLMLRGWL